MQPVSDQIQTIHQFLLGSVTSEHEVTRQFIKSIPASFVDFRPVPGAKSIGELMWYMVQVEHHSLSGICDGVFAPPPQQPEECRAESVLAWDD